MKTLQEQRTEAVLKMQERITKLEKEKAELRNKLEHRNCVDCSNHGSNIKLLKAKKLLKMVIDWQGRCGNGHPTWQEVCAKIEQFISEVEKCMNN